MAKDKEASKDGAKEALARIESTLGQICERLERLEAGAPAKTGMPKKELIAFLDQFRAGEALGEASLGAWIEVSDVACVRGGLRTVAQREGFHSRLLEARMKELGASPKFEIPDAVYEQAMKAVADPDKGDAQKLLDFTSRFADIDEALKPIHAIADRLDDDPETQSMLRTIVQDERSTLEFLHDACAQLNS